LKNFFDRLKKECKAADVKFQGHYTDNKQIKYDETISFDDFKSLFGVGGNQQGTLVQPTAQNKPNSTVYIIKFDNLTMIKSFFGEAFQEDKLKGTHWTRGGINFSKSVKIGKCDVEVNSLEVNYSKNSMKLTMKWSVSEKGGGSMQDFGHFRFFF